jgi:hypothetical protein
MPVLSTPSLLLKSAAHPTAVFLLPVVLVKSASNPYAAFWLPVVLFANSPEWFGGVF